MRFSRYLIAFAFIAITQFASAQVDTIGLSSHQLLTSFLKPGVRQYLVYSQNIKEPKKLVFWYWLRNISLAEQDGDPVFKISQQWLGPDTGNYRKIFSINRASDFSPLYHVETVKGLIKAFNWSRTRITGAGTVSGNLQKAFSLNFSAPNYNWNLDIETFEMLPLAKGKTFAINFYDAGLAPPAYVIYRVTGEEIIQTYDNQKVDCWKLATEGIYGANHYSETFWISKKNHEFLKEEDRFGDNYRYKVKMPASAVNFLLRYR